MRQRRRNPGVRERRLARGPMPAALVPRDRCAAAGAVRCRATSTRLRRLRTAAHWRSLHLASEQRAVRMRYPAGRPPANLPYMSLREGREAGKPRLGRASRGWPRAGCREARYQGSWLGWGGVLAKEAFSLDEAAVCGCLSLLPRAGQRLPPCTGTRPPCTGTRTAGCALGIQPTPDA
jgi:hypothetical protein